MHQRFPRKEIGVREYAMFVGASDSQLKKGRFWGLEGVCHVVGPRDV